MRRAFSLIAAIFFIVIISTIALLALSYSNMTTKSTGDIYLKEQAKLLAQSATEFAVMSMQAHNYPDLTPVAGTNCLERINLTYPNAAAALFNITVDIYYIDRNLGCTEANMIGRTDINGNARILPGGNRVGVSHAAIVEVSVSSNQNNFSGVPIRYVRRTLQKP